MASALTGPETGSPGKPRIQRTKDNTVNISFLKADPLPDKEIVMYQIRYNTQKKSNIKLVPAQDKLATHIDVELKMEQHVKYNITIKACYDDSTHGPECEWTEFCLDENTNIAVSLKQKIFAMAAPVEKSKDSPRYPITLQINLKMKQADQDTMIRKYTLGERDEAVLRTEKVIMLVGASGSGKSTLINAMANYLFGIKWTDKERLRMVDEGNKVSQAWAQTKWITCYTIHHDLGEKVPFSVTIIDTPGFGDPKGISRDDEITEQISTFFKTKGEKGIDHIDAVGFVTQSSLPRLTPTQRYVFDKILTIFGKDIEKNIIMLLTFADAQTPQVLSGIEKAGFNYKYSFKFNNSAIFANKTENEKTDYIEKLFWQMGETSLNDFFNAVGQCESRSLTMTKTVLKEREQLELNVHQMRHSIRLGLNQLEKIRVELNIVKKHEADIEANKEFTYTVQEDQVKTQSVQAGTFTTTCMICNISCHKKCKYRDDAKKYRCSRMNDKTPNSTCRVCPGHCSWKDHRNVPYIYVVERITVIKKYADLEERYKQGIKGKRSHMELVSELRKDFEEHQKKTLILTDENRQAILRLNEIALRPKPMTTIEYIDLMIRSEEGDKEPGFSERITELEELKRKAKFYADSLKDGFDPFESFQGVLSESYKKQNELKKDTNDYHVIRILKASKFMDRLKSGLLGTRRK